MANDAALGLLGLSRRAGRLACGEDQVYEMVQTGKCRAIFMAKDIGDATRRKIMRHDEKVPVFILETERMNLGHAIGMNGCEVCAVNDIGMANAIADKLKSTSDKNAMAAQRVLEKKTRMDSRKGKKKKK